MLQNQKAEQESKKLLNIRFRSKSAQSPEFAAAKFLAGQYDSRAMLAEIETFPPILRERAKVQALFYMAVKAFEANDFDGYIKHLKAACDLHQKSPTVTLEFEYHLAEILSNKVRMQNPSGSKGICF